MAKAGKSLGDARVGEVQYLDLATARSIIDRGLKKAFEIPVTGTFAVADEAGELLTMTRMLGASAAGLVITRGKASLTALQKEPSRTVVSRMSAHPERFVAFHDVYPQVYPGPGGMVIRMNGRIVGAYASGSGYGPILAARGIDPKALLRPDGTPGNAEDTITAYALGLAYQNHHPGMQFAGRLMGEDDEWTFGERRADNPDAPGWSNLGQGRPAMTLGLARAIADAVIATAEQQGVEAAVVVRDEVGLPMQFDRMAKAAPVVLSYAETRAKAAFVFGADTIAVDARPARTLPVADAVINCGRGGMRLVDPKSKSVIGFLGLDASDPAAVDMLVSAATKAIKN